MQNKLAKNYHFFSLLQYAFPTIVMMVFMSMYSIVDGVFVSRLVSTNALAAVNIVFPLLNVVMAVGIMLGAGGSAIIARKMGEGNNGQARQDFTLIVVIGIGLGALLMTIGILLIEPLLHFLGANEAVYDLGLVYAKTILIFTIPSILQMLFQMFFVTAGKPALGLTITLLGGAANIVLDYVFISIFQWGIAGAAAATGIGYSIPGLFGLLWFSLNRKGTLYFVKPVKNQGVILHTLTNGSSEMVTNLSAAVITYLFNKMMMKYLGEDGVAAITIVLYVEFLLVAVYLGFSSGIAPILSYNYGEGNRLQLKRLFRMSLYFVLGCSVISFSVSILCAKQLVGIFTPQGSQVYTLAVHGFYLYAICYLFKGINTFASSLFTALSDGITSAFLSFMRTLVLILPGLLLLPYVIKVDGIWLAVPLAEFLSVLLSLFCFARLFKTKLKLTIELVSADENTCDQINALQNQKDLVKRTSCQNSAASQVLAVYCSEKLIGFVRYTFDEQENNRVWLQQFKLDKFYDKQGYSHKTLSLLIESIRQKLNAEVCICLVPSDEKSKEMYRRAKFKCTGKCRLDEGVMMLEARV